MDGKAKGQTLSAWKTFTCLVSKWRVFELSFICIKCMSCVFIKRFSRLKKSYAGTRVVRFSCARRKNKEGREELPVDILFSPLSLCTWAKLTQLINRSSWASFFLKARHIHTFPLSPQCPGETQSGLCTLSPTSSGDCIKKTLIQRRRRFTLANKEQLLATDKGTLFPKAKCSWRQWHFFLSLFSAPGKLYGPSPKMYTRVQMSLWSTRKTFNLLLTIHSTVRVQ